MAAIVKFPDKDADLFQWSLNFSTKITATPTVYGLVAGQASAYATLHSNFGAALAAAAPSVRSKPTVSSKNDARLALKNSARSLAMIIQGTPTVTDSQKLGLGLSVQAPPTPTPAPTLAPLLKSISVTGSVGTYQVSDATFPNTRPRKPSNAEGATIMSFTGTTPPPAGDPGWILQGQTGKTMFKVDFGTNVIAGTACWVTALWYSRKGDYSPACDPVRVYLQIGGGSGSSVQSDTPDEEVEVLKKAA